LFGGNLKKVKNFAERAKVQILRNAPTPFRKPKKKENLRRPQFEDETKNDEQQNVEEEHEEIE
jgi:hypothetical protein